MAVNPSEASVVKQGPIWKNAREQDRASTPSLCPNCHGVRSVSVVEEASCSAQLTDPLDSAWGLAGAHCLFPGGELSDNSGRTVGRPAFFLMLSASVHPDTWFQRQTGTATISGASHRRGACLRASVFIQIHHARLAILRDEHRFSLMNQVCALKCGGPFSLSAGRMFV